MTSYPILTHKIDLTDAQLIDRAKRLKPLIEKDGSLYFIKPVDLRGSAFNWDPKTISIAKDFNKIAQVETRHSCGHPMMFKPSIAEVLEQTPSQMLLEGATAFTTVPLSSDINVSYDSTTGEHIALTTFYKGALPDKIKAQKIVHKK